MENVFFTSEPIVVLMLTIITVSLIMVGRKMELPQLPIIVVVYSLAFLVYHTIGVNMESINRSPYYFSIAVDLVMLFLGFITYLWIDDIVAQNKNKKSYSNALAWFWDKL